MGLLPSVRGTLTFLARPATEGLPKPIQPPTAAGLAQFVAKSFRRQQFSESSCTIEMPLLGKMSARLLPLPTLAT